MREGENTVTKRIFVLATLFALMMPAVSGAADIAFFDNGTYTEVITANGTDFKLRANADFVGSVDDVKVQEVTGGSGGLFAVNNLRGDVEAYIVDSTVTTTNSAGAKLI